MDSNLKKYLEEHKIDYKIHRHPAVFTVAESKVLLKDKSYFHTKSLFLKDEKGDFYLICLPAEKRLNTKSLAKKLSVKKLYFASPEEMKSEINLTPGSVSIFGMIYAKSVFLILDKEIWQAPVSGFHPNINTATLEIEHNNLEKFFNSLKSHKEIMELE
jgi:Ala-tRNA(Pro) deacylase